MDTSLDIRRFLDSDGRIIKLPHRRPQRLATLKYLAQHFQPERTYTEREVNALCDAWHTFGDYFMLRRELVDFGFLARERDGSRYWRTPLADAPDVCADGDETQTSAALSSENQPTSD